MWQSSLTWSDAKRRAGILTKIRAFFLQRQVLEVETPSLSSSTVTDAYLDAFSCLYDFNCASSTDISAPLYLQTSPEFHMKRLLASGFGCIFQLCKAFRHEDSGRFHNPEFTLLEWYRIGFDHLQLMDEVEQLLAMTLGVTRSDKITYQDVFLATLDIDPLTSDFEQLYQIIVKHDKASDWLRDSKDSDVLLQFIFAEIIEPNIGLEVPCFVYNFPRSQASLAKICPSDVRVAQRFECYYQGVELANGFNELTDCQEQQLRFAQDNEKRATLGLDQREMDGNFLSALKSGLPQCAGVALGVDRLMMIALEKNSIDQVISFAIERA